MKKPPPADNFFSALFVLSIAFFSFVFCACSDEPVKVSFTQAYLILDWENEEDFPVERLSVFLNLSTDVRRVDYFTVKNSEYTWNVESPIMFEAGDRQWIGSSSLSPPSALNAEPGIFPNGSYSVQCVDAAGRDSSSSFFLNYNMALLETKAGDVESILASAAKRISVYSESNELLYFDTQKDEWRDDKDIFANIKDSYYYRKSYVSGNLFCFMPKIYKDGEKPDGLE